MTAQLSKFTKNHSIFKMGTFYGLSIAPEWERNFVDDHCTNVLVWKLEMAAKESSIHPAMSIETVDNF